VLWSAVARWGDDPHTLGGVSFVPVGVDPAQRRALGGLVSPRLLLAGEAGATEHPGTVHGALRSGEREAARCMDLMRASQ
jgi:monoamine oxidase